MTISKSGLQSGNPLELLKLAYILSSDKLQSEFKKVQVEIQNEEDLHSLSEICNKKYDVDGKLKDGNGNPLMFDTVRILDSIKFSPEEQSKINSVTFID